MTHAEAIQSVYGWAFQVSGKKNTPALTLFCAVAVTKAIENRKDDAAAYDQIVELVRQWERDHKPGLKKPVELLTMMLGIEEGQEVA